MALFWRKKKKVKYGKTAVFCRRLWPDWENTARATTAGIVHTFECYLQIMQGSLPNPGLGIPQGECEWCI